MRNALLIGGGAPNSTLMAGALVAFLEEKLQFDVISTSGAGALMGLLYTVPKNHNPKQALTEWATVGVSDLIYRYFPVNYKVFMKPGDLAATYRDWLAHNPLTQPFYDPSSPFGTGLFSDWIKLCFATLSPSDLSSESLGLCASLPIADSLVNFAALKKIPPEFYINAYNMTKSKMTIWGKNEITPDHLKAAFAFPFIYPPYHLNGDDYIEGATMDTLNFKALVCDEKSSPGLHRELENLVIFDILGADQLIRKPRNLYDAWVRSIITPLVEIAKDDIRLFEYQYNIVPRTKKPKRKLLKVDLMGKIPAAQWDTVLDWSQSNLESLFEIGYQAGKHFCQTYGELLSK